MAEFQCNAVVVCDDVRREVNNKEILIGVYGGDIQVITMPATILLSFWLELIARKKGPYELTLRVQLPNPEHKFEVRVQGDAPDGRNPFSIVTPQVPYLFDRDGQLRLFAKFPGSERFELLKSKTIRYVPPSSFPQPAPNIGNSGLSPAA